MDQANSINITNNETVQKIYGTKVQKITNLPCHYVLAFMEFNFILVISGVEEERAAMITFFYCNLERYHTHFHIRNISI